MSDQPADGQPRADPVLSRAGGYVILLVIYALAGLVAFWSAVITGNPVPYAYVFIPVIGGSLCLSLLLISRGRPVVACLLGLLAFPLAVASLFAVGYTPTAVEAVTGWRLGTRHWREVVRTSDGMQFVVRRSEKKSLNSGLYDEVWIEGELPGAGYLSWHSSLSPWLLDRTSDGTWYLVGRTLSTKSDADYGLYGHRRIAFVAFQLVEGNWQRLTGAQFPAELKTPNLLVHGEFVFKPSGDENGICEGGRRAGALGMRALGNGDLVDLPMKSRFIPCGNERPRPDYELKRERFDDGLHNTRQCEPLRCGPLPAQQPMKR